MSKRKQSDLKNKFDAIVDEFVDRLLQIWGDSYSKEYGYWVADDKTGLYCYGDEIFINLQDIIFCVENNVSDDTYIEWINYCNDAGEFGFEIPNFKSWVMGCPRVPRESIEKLQKMKQRLEEIVEQEKEKYKNIQLEPKNRIFA